MLNILVFIGFGFIEHQMAVYPDGTAITFFDIFCTFFENFARKICRFQKNAYLCIRVREKRISLNNWCGSSAG